MFLDSRSALALADVRRGMDDGGITSKASLQGSGDETGDRLPGRGVDRRPDIWLQTHEDSDKTRETHYL